jgi:hypothetical protein
MCRGDEPRNHPASLSRSCALSQNQGQIEMLVDYGHQRLAAVIGQVNFYVLTGDRGRVGDNGPIAQASGQWPGDGDGAAFTGGHVGAVNR